MRHHHAVLTEADAQAVPAGLEVDIADTVGQRVLEHLVHARHGAAFAALHDHGGRRDLALRPGHGRGQRSPAADGHDQVLTEVPLGDVDVLAVHGVRKHHHHAIALAPHGHEEVRLVDRDGRASQQLRVEGGRVGLHRRQSELIGQHLHDLEFVHEVVVDEDLANRRVGVLVLQRQRELQFLGLEPAELHEHLTQRRVHLAGTQGRTNLILGDELEFDQYRRQGARRLDLRVHTRRQRDLGRCQLTVRDQQRRELLGN